MGLSFASSGFAKLLSTEHSMGGLCINGLVLMLVGMILSFWIAIQQRKAKRVKRILDVTSKTGVGWLGYCFWGIMSFGTTYFSSFFSCIVAALRHGIMDAGGN
ncbi:MAG: hypothetical protein R2795_01560 [Saprospiraceae bacterium]